MKPLFRKERRIDWLFVAVVMVLWMVSIGMAGVLSSRCAPVQPPITPSDGVTATVTV